ncbi:MULTISPECIES: ABC transporter ATP-binding protein [unclassified Streptomyces]|uniref:ABC transporter ATP-binding protein n=1 Tax=Streptomyces sp. SYP-A7185 TaxID=3040076 RepID=UPI0038F77EB6
MTTGAKGTNDPTSPTGTTGLTGTTGARGATSTVDAARVTKAVKVYGGGDTAVRALDGVSVGFPAGRFTAIMGPSGSGKSTLMHCAAGLDTLTSGAAHIGDTELGGLDDRRLTLLRRDRIGFVFQAFNLVPTLTVAENITLPMDLAGKRGDGASAEWIDALVDVVGLGDRLHHRPAELSGGQQQRVAVARAFAGRPDVVFADEPTGNLDSRSGEEVLRLLGRAVRQMGRTVVMVTHDPVAAAHADEVVFLADGRLVDRMADPTADKVLDRLKAFDPQTPTGPHPRPRTQPEPHPHSQPHPHTKGAPS